MKSSWTIGLRGIVALALLTGAAPARGQTYRRAAVDEALERLRETLREEGLYQAEVSAETVPHAETHQMDIVVHVKPGPRARVGIIQLRNSTEYRDADILSRLRMKS